MPAHGAPTSSNGRRPALDGVRGLAITLVLASHLLGANGAGMVGVLLFFVLSGYLITGLLADQFTRKGRLDLWSFYVRRGLRLLPALLVLLFGYLAAVGLWGLGTTVGEASRGVLFGLFYITDFALGLQWGYVPDLAHLWTLAVEEQFYLLWPLVILGALRRREGTNLLRAMVLLLVIGALLRVTTLLMAPRWGLFSYALPTTWVDTLVLGGVLALARRQGPRLLALLKSRAALGWLGICVLLGGAAITNLQVFSLTYSVGIPVFAVAAVLLINELEARGKGLLQAVFTSRILVHLGEVSYGVYLFNSTFIMITRRCLGDSFQLRAAAMLAALVAAEVCFRWVERPVLRFKDRFAT